MFRSFSEFADAAKELPGSVRSFVQELEKRGFTPVKNVPAVDGKRVRGFSGVALRLSPMRSRVPMIETVRGRFEVLCAVFAPGARARSF